MRTIPAFFMVIALMVMAQVGLASPASKESKPVPVPEFLSRAAMFKTAGEYQQYFAPDLNVPEGIDDPKQCDHFNFCKPAGSFRDDQANEFSKIAIAAGKSPEELFAGIYYAYEYLQGEIHHDNEQKDTSILGSMAGLFRQFSYVPPRDNAEARVIMPKFGSIMVMNPKFRAGELQLLLLLTMLLEKPVYLRFHDETTNMVTFKYDPVTSTFSIKQAYEQPRSVEEEGAVVLIQNLLSDDVSFRYFRPSREDLHKGARKQGIIKKIYTSEVVSQQQVQSLQAYVKGFMEEKRGKRQLSDKKAKAAEIKRMESLLIADTILDIFERRKKNALIKLDKVLDSIEITPTQLHDLHFLFKAKADVLSPELNAKVAAATPMCMNCDKTPGKRALLRYLKSALHVDQLKFSKEERSRMAKAYDMIQIRENKKSDYR